MSNRSAFESVPGRDALVEYESKAYPIKTYVERNGLIYKSISATSETFVLSQWELVGDLREVRVPDIAARNTLTGTTGTSYGVHTPILDNTNVLVLDASADPQVGIAQFARYNYNLAGASWLLLQIGTGSTSAATSIEYANVLNRPFIVSGVTVNAGAGLSGGGAVFGSIPAAGGVISIAHADTSSQSNVTPTGLTYIQQLKFDTFGHVTGATQSTWTHPDTSSQANVLNTGRTYIQSISVDGDGHITNIASSPWTHPDTSNQANSLNSGSTFIQTLYLDGDGHVIGIGTGVASGGGGGGSALTYNGDSGGVLTMNSGATLTISGGSNILTVRTGNVANPGLRINFNPAGLVNQVQFNNGSGLGASSNFVFSAGTSTLRTNNYIIGAIPASGSTADHFLSRNTTTGAVQRIAINTIANSVLANLTTANGLTKVGNQIRLGGTITGHTSIAGSSFDFTFATRSVTLGTRTGGIVGANTFAVGLTNEVTISNSFALGNSNTVSGVTGANSHGFAFGYANRVRNNLASPNANFALGSLNYVTGTTFNSGALGSNNTVGGTNAYVIGTYGKADGAQSIVIGNGDSSIKRLYASATKAINISNNTAVQVAGHGANAQFSAIFGGSDHNIETSNTRAVIVGGFNIKLTGSTYTNYTAVGSLAIMSAPTIGIIPTDDVLVRRSTTGTIHRITQATLVTANNGLTKVGANVRLGGALTGNTVISGGFNINFSNTSWTFGSRSGTTGTNSLTSGISNLASGAYSASFGQQSKSVGSGSFSAGAFANASGDQSSAFGWGGNATGMGSFASGFGNGAGKGVLAAGSFSFNHSFNHNITQIAGHGALAQSSAILGGENHNIESGNVRAAVIGGSGIKLTGSSYIDHTAVANFAIMSTPAVGLSGDDILVRRSTNGRIFRVTQASVVTANNGLTKVGANVRLGGALTGNTTVSGSVNITFNNGSYTFGTRSVGVVGGGSYSWGTNNVAAGLNSLVMGVSAKASGNTSIAMGSVVSATGLRATAIGWMTSGDVTKPVLAAGDGSFNLSNNSAGQTIGHGALASYSAIFGGQDHNIEASNTGAVILGGSGIKLTAGYQDFVAMRSLALFTNPLAGVGADDVLVWNSTDKKVKKVTQASISDERLKKNLQPLTGVLEKIVNLNTVEFEYNDKNQPELVDRKDYGLIAQEVEQVYPHVVNDNLSIDGDETKYKTLEYRKLVPILFAAIKELKLEIDNLKTKNCNCTCHG